MKCNGGATKETTNRRYDSRKRPKRDDEQKSVTKKGHSNIDSGTITEKSKIGISKGEKGRKGIRNNKAAQKKAINKEINISGKQAKLERRK